jgi:hypothetical protein
VNGRARAANPLGIEELSRLYEARKPSFYAVIIKLYLPTPPTADVGSYSACHTVIRKTKRHGREPVSFC